MYRAGGAQSPALATWIAGTWLETVTVAFLRVQQLFGLARRLSDANLAELAAAAGYADQPHMSRDCRTLTGATPARLVRSQRHLR